MDIYNTETRNGLDYCKGDYQSPGQDSNELDSPKSDSSGGYRLNSVGETESESSVISANNSDSSSDQIANVLLSLDTTKNGPRRNKRKGTHKYRLEFITTKLHHNKEDEIVKYRAYHKEIERRRRTRIRDTIMELADIVPSCKGLSSRLDKLTILKLAAQHFRLLSKIRLNEEESAENSSNLYFKELKSVIEDSSGGCLVILRCKDAHIMHVSDYAKNLLSVSPADLVGKDLLQLVLPSDSAIIKQQLFQASNISSVNTSANECNGDLNEPSPPGMRRSFYCRLNVGQFSDANAKNTSTPILSDCRHANKQSRPPLSVNFTGSIRQCASNNSNGDDGLNDGPYFVGICRPVNTSQSPRHGHLYNAIVESPKSFVTYHSADAKYLRVDSSITMATGLLPQDLIGRCMYEFVHAEDHVIVANAFKSALSSPGSTKSLSGVFRMLCGDKDILFLRLSASCLVNPATQQLEFVILENIIINCDEHGMGEQPNSASMANVSNFEQQDLSNHSVSPSLVREFAVPRSPAYSNSPSMTMALARSSNSAAESFVYATSFEMLDRRIQGCDGIKVDGTGQ